MRAKYELNSDEEMELHDILKEFGNDLQHVIYSTITHLHPEIREFIFDQCHFVSMEGLYGRCVYERCRRPWLIILNENADEFTIAHEIAHAYLGHNKHEEGRDIEIGKKQEDEADSLAKKWGFSEKKGR